MPRTHKPSIVEQIANEHAKARAPQPVVAATKEALVQSEVARAERALEGAIEDLQERLARLKSGLDAQRKGFPFAGDSIVVAQGAMFVCQAVDQLHERVAFLKVLRS